MTTEKSSCQFYWITMSGHALKKVQLWLSKRAAAFYQNNRSTVGLLQHLVYSWMCPFWSAESKHWIKPLCAVLVNLRSAGVNAKLKNRKQGRDPRGTSTPRPCTRCPPILLNLSWCWSSTPHGLQWQQTAKAFIRGTLKRFCFSVRAVRNTFERRTKRSKGSNKKAY